MNNSLVFFLSKLGNGNLEKGKVMGHAEGITAWYLAFSYLFLKRNLSLLFPSPIWELTFDRGDPFFGSVSKWDELISAFLCSLSALVREYP